MERFPINIFTSQMSEVQKVEELVKQHQEHSSTGILFRRVESLRIRQLSSCACLKITTKRPSQRLSRTLLYARGTGLEAELCDRLLLLLPYFLVLGWDPQQRGSWRGCVSVVNHMRRWPSLASLQNNLILCLIIFQNVKRKIQSNYGIHKPFLPLKKRRRK